MTATPAPQSKIVSWFWAARPFSLSASVAPVLVGTALAATAGALDWLLFALALTGSVAIQIGTNLTDEYSDHRKSGGEGKFLAPHKVIQRGLLSERAVALGMAAAFGYGIVAGLVIVAHVGWPILAVGLASVAAAYLYAGGPKPLGTLGLGEPVVFVFMGPLMVMAAYYVQQEALTLASFYVSLPVAFIVTAILMVNNIRDVEEDREAGKRSLATAAGARVAMWSYAAMLAAAVLEHRRGDARRRGELLGAPGARAAAMGRRCGAGAVRGAGAPRDEPGCSCAAGSCTAGPASRSRRGCMRRVCEGQGVSCIRYTYSAIVYTYIRPEKQR